MPGKTETMKRFYTPMTAVLAAHLLASTAPFANPGWKTDDAGNIVKDADGNPVWLDANSKESSVKGDTISRLNDEAKTHREAKEAAETKLKAFEGIDPAKAKDALEKVGKIDQKQLIDAGEVDRVRASITEQYDSKLKEKDTQIAELSGTLNTTLLKTAFQGSKFVADKLAIPPDIAQSFFGGRFKTEGAKVIPLDANGNPMLSHKNMGENADFDEAIELMVTAYPNRDAILKGGGQSGTGNQGGGGTGGGTGKRTYKRSEFNQLNPQQQAAVAAQVPKGEAAIIDG